MKSSFLISAVEGVLTQGRTLLETISSEEYVQKENGASIGAHYRHVLDHFLCLIDGLGNAEINYDHRGRSPELEGSVDAALAATEDLSDAFRGLSADALSQPCTVVYSVGYGHEKAQAVPSVVAREVMFCVGHAIHHYAILRLLCAGMSVGLPYEFGIAPSTLKHAEAHASR
jgi:uncharacterized damage-inducible protein DinB